MSNIDLRRFGSPEELAGNAASAWLDQAQRHIRAKGGFSTALLGGRIAGRLFSSIAELASSERIALDAVDFFWSDERCVPSDSPDSNYAIARDRLLVPLRIHEGRIHRVRGEILPDKAAAVAQVEMLERLPSNPDGQPVCDLVLLGLGENGHVASLFPEEPEEVRASKAVFRPVIATKPPPQRITMGYPAIAAAAQVWVLVSGEGKEGAFRESLKPEGLTPFARVLRSRTLTRIFTDLHV